VSVSVFPSSLLSSSFFILSEEYDFYPSITCLYHFILILNFIRFSFILSTLRSNP
jgi:hypothetical protein